MRYSIVSWTLFDGGMFLIYTFENGKYSSHVELTRVQKEVAEKIVSLMKLESRWKASFYTSGNVPAKFVTLLTYLSKIPDEILESLEMEKVKKLKELEGWLALAYLLSDRKDKEKRRESRK
jgi:hypothetical protein